MSDNRFITIAAVIDRYAKNTAKPDDITIKLIDSRGNKESVSIYDHVDNEGLEKASFFDKLHSFVNYYKNHQDRYGDFWVWYKSGAFKLIKDDGKPV